MNLDGKEIVIRTFLHLGQDDTVIDDPDKILLLADAKLLSENPAEADDIAGRRRRHLVARGRAIGPLQSIRARVIDGRRDERAVAANRGNAVRISRTRQLCYQKHRWANGTWRGGKTQLVGERRSLREDVLGVGVSAENHLLSANASPRVAVNDPALAIRSLLEGLDRRPRVEPEVRGRRGEGLLDKLCSQLVRVHGACRPELAADSILDARNLQEEGERAG